MKCYFFKQLNNKILFKIIEVLYKGQIKYNCLNKAEESDSFIF